jgi:alanine-glyoxylate transaminase/serine-glyoxylate transaminase/serine-pyruvate transaminase
MPVSAPGSAGMEACFVNLVEPGDKVIVCQNGVFGGRMKENVERCGGEAVMVQDAWGRAVDPQKLEDALKAHPDARILAFVHAETSTGAAVRRQNPGRTGHRHDCLAIVDAVTSLAGTPWLVDAWGIDAVYSGTQKCLSCTPGIVAGELQRARARASISPHRTQGAELVPRHEPRDGLLGKGDPRAYHHTAPVNALYACTSPC